MSKLILILILLESLINDDTHKVDLQPLMEKAENACPEGFIPKYLNKPKCNKCSPNCTQNENEQFHLKDNTLVMLKDGKHYKTNEFCVHPNPDAESKYDHFATICVEHTER